MTEEFHTPIPSITRKFTLIGGNDGRDLDCYICVGVIEGRVVHVSITLGKLGDELRVYHVLCDIINLALKTGATLDQILRLLEFTSFTPAGFTQSEEIRRVDSLCDLIGKYLRLRFWRPGQRLACMMYCSKCDGTGFLGLGEPVGRPGNRLVDILKSSPGARICDCCGDGETWYGIAGQHYGPEDPMGAHGPYAYNGGLCECH